MLISLEDARRMAAQNVTTSADPQPPTEPDTQTTTKPTVSDFDPDQIGDIIPQETFYERFWEERENESKRIFGTKGDAKR